VCPDESSSWSVLPDEPIFRLQWIEDLECPSAWDHKATIQGSISQPRLVYDRDSLHKAEISVPICVRQVAAYRIRPSAMLPAEIDQKSSFLIMPIHHTSPPAEIFHREVHPRKPTGCHSRSHSSLLNSKSMSRVECAHINMPLDHGDFPS